MVPDTFGAVTLLVVAERAAALVPAFQAFLLTCSLPGDPVGSLGREGHRLATEFDCLHGWVADSPGAPGFETERSCLLTALSYHRMIVHDALRLTFPKVRTARTDSLRAALGEHSTLTADLLDLPARLGRA
ncbi:MAG: hypothetical protein ABS81_31625 [Pseudonocardia sp. SCN 72-86]|nr:MAG: hypothetical protein ABS81_31625 [Pseudonocardia sp. SCN 72-86]